MEIFVMTEKPSDSFVAAIAKEHRRINERRSSFYGVPSARSHDGGYIPVLTLHEDLRPELPVELPATDTVCKTEIVARRLAEAARVEAIRIEPPTLTYQQFKALGHPARAFIVDPELKTIRETRIPQGKPDEIARVLGVERLVELHSATTSIWCPHQDQKKPETCALVAPSLDALPGPFLVTGRFSGDRIPDAPFVSVEDLAGATRFLKAWQAKEIESLAAKAFGSDTFHMVEETSGAIYLKDNDQQDGPSLTNQMPIVAEVLALAHPGKNIAYRDSEGCWAEAKINDKPLNSWRPKFAGFAPFAGWVPDVGYSSFVDKEQDAARFALAEKDLEARLRGSQIPGVDGLTLVEPPRKGADPVVMATFADPNGPDEASYTAQLRIPPLATMFLPGQIVHAVPGKESVYVEDNLPPEVSKAIDMACAVMDAWRDQKPFAHVVPDAKRVAELGADTAADHLSAMRAKGIADGYLVLKDADGAIIADPEFGEVYAASGAYADVKTVDVLEHQGFWAGYGFEEQVAVSQGSPKDFGHFLKDDSYRQADTSFREATFTALEDVKAPDMSNDHVLEAIPDCTEWLVNENKGFESFPALVHDKAVEMAKELVLGKTDQQRIEAVHQIRLANDAAAQSRVESVRDMSGSVADLMADSASIENPSAHRAL